MNRDPSSFRDPSGFIFLHEKIVYRQINECYREQYDLLLSSGLYRKLTSDNRLITHDECPDISSGVDGGYKTIRPMPIPFISYPYEWCFSQLKDAALLTLSIAKTALDHGMILKDASAYNIQFNGYKPVFIDTLSFERYSDGKPWIAYRQFCEHFLAPLALMKFRDIRLHQMMQTNIDGIPLDLTMKLLPKRAFFSLSLFIHLFLHAMSKKAKYGTVPEKTTARSFSKQAFSGLIDSLESAVRKINLPKKQSEWEVYYRNCSYSQQALDNKAELVVRYIERVHPISVWDFGANTAFFSKLAASRCRLVVSFDFDPQCIEAVWRDVSTSARNNILPLIMDITNPSPSIGWHNEERKSLIERGPADMALCLALIHHLAIAKNIPFGFIARFFAEVCTWLIMEFVPKDDRQVRELLAVRKDIFDHYTAEAFEGIFSNLFSIEHRVPVADTGRTMYLMKKR